MGTVNVFWSARNLAHRMNPFGNHHFILIDGAVATGGLPLEQYKGQTFITLGGFSIGGNLVFEANNQSDKDSVKEHIDDPAWWRADFGFRGNLIPPPSGNSTAFAELLCRYSLNYRENEKIKPIPYTLFNGICSAWVNTILKAAGVPDHVRNKAGDFWGIDAGEKVEIPEEMFTGKIEDGGQYPSNPYIDPIYKPKDPYIKTP